MCNAIEKHTKERPIIFNAHDVRAILGGGKTQTRRLLNADMPETRGGRWDFIGDSGKKSERNKWCYSWIDQWGNRISPKGKEPGCLVTPPCLPGDRLWVREKWAWYPMEEDKACCIYHADFDPEACLPSEYGAWKSSIHMPRWASRIMLDVVDVRVERLHDISDADIAAEGLKSLSKDGGRTWKTGLPGRDGLPDGDGWTWRDWEQDPCCAYKRLWEEAYPKTWSTDPWVWVIEFRRVEP